MLEKLSYIDLEPFSFFLRNGIFLCSLRNNFTHLMENSPTKATKVARFIAWKHTKMTDQVIRPSQKTVCQQ